LENFEVKCGEIAGINKMNIAFKKNPLIYEPLRRAFSDAFSEFL